MVLLLVYLLRWRSKNYLPFLQGDLSRALELSKQDQYNTSAGVYCVSPIKSDPAPKSSRPNKPPSRAMELLEQEYKSSSSSELCAVSPIKDDDDHPAPVSRPKTSSNPVKTGTTAKDDKNLSKIKCENKERKPLSTGKNEEKARCLSISHLNRLFLDVFPQQSKTPSWQNLEFFANFLEFLKNILSFSENSLSLYEKVVSFFSMPLIQGLLSRKTPVWTSFSAQSITLWTSFLRKN